MRITRPFVLLALAVLLAPPAEASRTGVSESNRPSSLTAMRVDEVGLLASVAPAARLDTNTPADSEIVDSPRLDLGDVSLVESELEHGGRFDLGPLELLGPAPLRGPPPSYPETRVRGFELLPPFRGGASPRLSLWSRQACSFPCLGLVSDSRYDPWGLTSLWDRIKQKASETWKQWTGAGQAAQQRVERGIDENLAPPPDPTHDPYGAADALRDLGFEGQSSREKAAGAGAEVRKDAVRAGGLAARGTVEVGKFAVENKVLGMAIGAIGKGARGPGRWMKASESMSERAAAYQSQISGRAPGEVYLVGGVKFDAFENGLLLDAKGPGYATFVDKGRFMDFFEGADTLVDQAQRQLRAANGTPVRWHVAESEAATAMRNLLRERGLGAQVEIIHTPPM